jgi:hypothetical protein
VVCGQLLIAETTADEVAVGFLLSLLDKARKPADAGSSGGLKKAGQRD